MPESNIAKPCPTVSSASSKRGDHGAAILLKKAPFRCDYCVGVYVVVSCSVGYRLTYKYVRGIYILEAYCAVCKSRLRKTQSVVPSSRVHSC